MMHLTYHEIVSLDDEKYDDWLDLYQVAFPVSEQMRISELNRVLRQKQSGNVSSSHLLIATDDAAAVAAMVMYDDDDGCGAATLWYVAVAPSRQNQGIGTQVYQEIRRRVFAHAGTRALLMEVEDPETCHSSEERQLAVRRIEFYRRLGIKRLGGIAYLQSVGWQPPVPMQLMVDCPEERPLSEVFVLAECVFGSAMQRVGVPELL